MRAGRCAVHVNSVGKVRAGHAAGDAPQDEHTRRGCALRQGNTQCNMFAWCHAYVDMRMTPEKALTQTWHKTSRVHVLATRHVFIHPEQPDCSPAVH